MLMEKYKSGKWNNIYLENGKIQIWKMEQYRSGNGKIYIW